jgi:hypothetical protein
VLRERLARVRRWAGTRHATHRTAAIDGRPHEEINMSIPLALLFIVILLLLGALPAWPYSAGWGYWPSGGLGLVLLVVVILLLMGQI